MKKPLFAFITDTHLEESNIEVNLRAFQEVSVLMKEKGFNRLVHGGDVFDSRKSQTMPIQQTFRKILRDLYNKRIEVHCIPGNHDKTDYNSEESFLDVYEHNPNFYLYRTPQLLVLPDVVVGFMPFFSDDLYSDYYQDLLTQMEDELSEVEKSKPKVLITHIGIDGVKMNNGSRQKSSIKYSIFSDFTKVLVGHFHDRSTYGKNVIYTGSAYQHNFGENEDKGVVFVYSDLSLEFIPLQTPPKYYKFEKEYSEINNEFLDNLIAFKQSDNESNFRLEISGSNSSTLSFIKKDLGDHGIEVTIPVHTVEREEVISSLSTYNQEGLKQEFIQFCNERSFSSEDGLEYLNQVL